MEANAGPRMKEIGATIGSDFPSRGEGWPNLRIRAEASESGEQVGYCASGWNIGGERGVERFGIVAVACVAQGAAKGGIAAVAGGEQHERDERKTSANE